MIFFLNFNIIIKKKIMNINKEKAFLKILKEYNEFKLTDPRTAEEKKEVYDIKYLTNNQRKNIAQKSGRHSNNLILQNKDVVSSTFYYNIKLKEASGQYYVYKNGILELVTWYYNYKTKYLFYI